MAKNISKKNHKVDIGENKFLSAKNTNGVYDIKIGEGDGTKCVEFTLQRWALFTKSINSIEAYLRYKFETHIGGGWFTTPTNCGYVDFRKFYVLLGQSNLKPTDFGITLSIQEWEKLKEVTPHLHKDSPEIADAESCIYNKDHVTWKDFTSCFECTPFNPYNALTDNMCEQYLKMENSMDREHYHDKDSLYQCDCGY